MNQIFKIICIFQSVFYLSLTSYAQSVKINELMSSNRDVVYDENMESPDWVEVMNYGSTPINLIDYYISDDSKDLKKWRFPSYSLVPQKSLLVYTSGKNRLQVPLFFYNLIDKGDKWRYILPSGEVPSNWKTREFNDQTWGIGSSGFGYGDNDDSTLVPANTRSVFMRHKFSPGELTNLQSLWLHIDYDDAFVAYLNGTEIARSGIGTKGDFTPFDKMADIQHEAVIYTGKAPESFNVSQFISLLEKGENILSVQVHNNGQTSSDFTAIPFLSAGYISPISNAKPVSKYTNLPSLFPHTNFKLSSDGESLYLSHRLGTLVDTVTFGKIPGNYSYGRSYNTPSKWGYFDLPTPGLSNTTPMTSGVTESIVQFSVSELYLNKTSGIELSGAKAGEEIRYTINNSEPTLQSNLYLKPITISKNTVIRARVYKTGSVPGIIRSKTYLFDAHSTLPVISVSTDSVNLWDTQTGIYVLGDEYENKIPYFGANFWEDWEKPANVEMINTNGDKVFSLNCGISIFGNWSRANKQKSLSIHFRNEYGDSELKNVQLFSSKPLSTFSSLVLRNSGNDFSYSKMRDGMMTSLVRGMDTDISAYRPTVLYLNGEYWGIINLREKINEDYLESNHGVDADELDIIENNGTVVEGDNRAFLELNNLVSSLNLSGMQNYSEIEKRIEISNYIDYQISEIYFDNGDWPGNNLKLWKPRIENGKWRWLLFDTDFGFGLYNANNYITNTLEFATATNGQNWPNPPWSTLTFRKLLENQTFRNRFINRFADLMNTTFKDTEVLKHINATASVIEPEITRNYQKWLVPTYNNWKTIIENMRVFARNRVPNVRNHIRQKFALPNNHDVDFQFYPSEGGSVQLNTIEVTTPGWRGMYFENVPIKITALPKPGFRFKNWVINGITSYSGSIEINVTKPTSVAVWYETTTEPEQTIVFNEINYNSSADRDAGDWVELFNPGKTNVDISSWIFKDDDDEHIFKIPQNTIINAGDYLVLCRDKILFKKTHTTVSKYIGDFSFGLSSSGDVVRLFNTRNQLIDKVEFENATPWPWQPNGNGPTLELRNPALDNSLPESWRASAISAGTPGKQNSIPTPVELFANKTVFHKVEVYPNPFHAETTIRLGNSLMNNFKLQIYSMDGKLVYNANSTGNQLVWKGENNSGQKLHNGIYFCKVFSNEKAETVRIILSR